MRRLAIGVLAATVPCGVARAQTPAEPNRGYAEAVAQSAFGNVTSQSYGGEIGFTVMPSLQVFVEAGQVRNSAPDSLGTNAQLIAGALGQTNSGVGFTVKQPIAFGIGGIRYLMPTTGKAAPYVLAGGGAARVSKNVTFTIGGTDVTSSLQQYGVVLGSDLAGDETKPMLSLGAGVTYPLLQRLVLDLQYRYGRVFASGGGINVHRAGAGIGVRF